MKFSMTFFKHSMLFIVALVLSAGCAPKGENPRDPFEHYNRKVYRFNRSFDNAFLKPVAKVYVAITPPFVQTASSNFFNNLYQMPTVANDLLQAEYLHAIKDTWRFIINSTLGIAGTVDVAEKFGIEPHTNDLGITLARWGDTNSPYFVIPFFGPSTIRDSFALMFDYNLFTIYPYIKPESLLYGILAYRYIDLRAQLLESDVLLEEALDPYSFMRDAYLQYRDNKIHTEMGQIEEIQYIEEDEPDASSPLLNQEKA